MVSSHADRFVSHEEVASLKNPLYNPKEAEHEDHQHQQHDHSHHNRA